MKCASELAKDALVEALCRWTDDAEPMTDARRKEFYDIADDLIRSLDAAGFGVERKVPVGGEIKAVDIGHQALKVRRAEAAVKGWLAEQVRVGNLVSAHHAPGWREYQQAHERFNSAVTAAENRERLQRGDRLRPEVIHS